MRAEDFNYFKLSPRTTIEEVNEQYEDMLWEMHPDRGGDHDAFVAMREEFEEALRYVARYGARQAQREQAAALLSMVVEEVVRDPSVIGTMIRRIQNGQATEWFKSKGLEFIRQFFKDMKAG